MSFSRRDFAENILRLKGNGHWSHYVQTLESVFNDRVTALLQSDHPDVALRGECRALHNLLKTINNNSDTTP